MLVTETATVPQTPAPSGDPSSRVSVSRIVIAPLPANRAGLDALFARQGPSRVVWAVVCGDPTRTLLIERWITGRARAMRVQPLIRTIASDLRDSYQQYIADLSRRYASDQWWARCVSEKNPYVSLTFYRLCVVLAFSRALAEEEADVAFLFADSVAVRHVLGQTLRSVAPVATVEPSWWLFRERVRAAAMDLAKIPWYTAVMCGRIVLARYVYRLHRHPPLVATIERARPVTLIQAWADERAYDRKNGQFIDAEFGQVASYLRGRGCTVVSLPRVMMRAPFARIARALGRTDHPIALPEAFLRPQDVLASLVRGLRRVDCRWTYPRFAGIEPTVLFEEDLNREQRKLRISADWLFARSIRRMKEAGLIVERAIYTFENHTWEKVFCLEIRRAYPEVRLIAQQFGSVPSLLMNFLISRDERDVMPLPDRIVATGPYCAAMMADGYGGERVVVGGALRGPTVLPLPVRDRTPGRRRRIIVACSIGLTETLELVTKAARALSDVDGDVMIKCHPLLPYKRVVRFLSSPLPKNFAFTERPLDELFNDAAVMLYGRTAVCLFALSRGVPMVHVETDFHLDYDHLECAAHLRRSACEIAEIREAVQLVLSGRDPALTESELRRVGEAVYAPVDAGVLEKFLG